MSRHPNYNTPHGFKRCAMCAMTKPRAEFPAHRGNPSGLDSYCRTCKVERARQLRAKLMGRADPTLAARFWPKVNTKAPNGCWEWTGALRSGYGVMLENNRTIAAHRISLKLAGWKLPASREEAVVDHMCRNRKCVNPAHLRLVSQRVNALENNDSPLAINSNKTHCKNGHLLAGDNIRWIPCRGPKGTPMAARKCIACYAARRPTCKPLKPNRRSDVLPGRE